MLLVVACRRNAEQHQDVTNLPLIGQKKSKLCPVEPLPEETLDVISFLQLMEEQENIEGSVTLGAVGELAIVGELQKAPSRMVKITTGEGVTLRRVKGIVDRINHTQVVIRVVRDNETILCGARSTCILCDLLDWAPLLGLRRPLRDSALLDFGLLLGTRFRKFLKRTLVGLPGPRQRWLRLR